MLKQRSPEETAAYELLICYRRGWKHGANQNVKNKDFAQHARDDIRDAYVRGYDDGSLACADAVRAEAAHLGYDPTNDILRERKES